MSRKIALVGSKLASAERKAPGGLVGRAMRFCHRSLVVTLSVLLFLQPAIANAQSVSAAGSAPVANQPGVGAAPNGVPLVDIVTPNASGLSHNKYNDFNVGTQGLILNNFNGEQGTSNLGGITPGNPNLRNSGPASVILNEVTSGNRSALNGPTEIYGGRADVIIANPNGITCNGCGFVNTPHATLTTGVPDIGADGRLTGFTVNGGDVTFEGAGGNFAAAPGSVDLFDVVSRQIHVNGPVYGKSIRLTGGASKYDYATGEATALTATSGTPEYAIDGSALGAMQADRIKVVVTEKGAGVKMSGDMAANTGELSLSADGKISIGNASGRDGVTITSKQKVTAAKVTSKQKVAVRADQGVTLQSVAADGDIVLASGAGLLSVSGGINSGTTIQMNSGGGITAGSVTTGNGAATLVATSGDIAVAGAANSAGDLTMTAAAGAISASSLQSSRNIAVNAGLGFSVAGNVQAQGNINATGRSISAGKIISGLNIAATSADPNGNVVLGTAGDLSLTAIGGSMTTGNLLSAGSLNAGATGNLSAGGIQSANDLSISAASLTASGVTAHGALTVNAAGGRVDVSGQLLAASNVLISGSSLQAGAIAAGVDFAATDANGGGIVIGSSGTLGLTARAGSIVTDKLLSAGDMTVQSAALQANNLTSHGNVAINAGGVTVVNQLLSAGNVVINSSANGFDVGLLASGVDFGATKAAGGNIALAHGGDLTIRGSSGAVKVGTVLAAGAVSANARTITFDTITGQKDIALSAASDATAGSGTVKVTGQLLGGGNVGISGSSIAADTIVSGVDISATNAAGGHITLGKTIAGTGNLTLVASDLLSAGTLLSSGDLDGSGSSLIAGTISAHGNMTLGGAVNVSNQILSAGNMRINGPNVSARTIVAGIDFDATDAAGGKVALGQTGDLNLTAGGSIAASTMEAAGNLTANGTAITADGVTAHKAITLAGSAGAPTASGRVEISGQVLAGSDVSVSGAAIKAGSVVSGVDFAKTALSNGAIVQTTSGNLTLASSGAIDVGTVQSAGALSTNGATVTVDTVTAHGDMTIGGGAIQVNRQILGAGNVLISGDSLSAQAIAAGLDFGATNANGGKIVLGQAGDLTVSVNGALTAPTIQAAGAIRASGATLTADAITGHKDVTLSGATTVTNQILGGRNVSISGPAIKADSVVSGVDFAATAAAGGGIVLTGSGDLSLVSIRDLTVGTLISAGDLTASGSTMTAGAVTAHRDMTLGDPATGAARIAVAGQILAARNVLITGQSLSAKTIAAGLDFAATDATNGTITLGQTGDLKIIAGGDIAASTIAAAGSINASGTTVTANAVTGHKNVALVGAAAAPGRVDIKDQVLAGGNATISGRSVKIGTIVSGVDFAATAAAGGGIVLAHSGDLMLTSDGLINVGTLLSAGDLNASGATISADKITAHRDITLAGTIDVSNQILGAGNVLISGQSLSVQTIAAGLDFVASDAAGGRIILGQSGDLTIAESGAVAVPTVEAAGAIDIRASEVSSDAITSHKDIAISGPSGTQATGARIAVAGQILGGANINLSGSTITAGEIISGVDFSATSAANGHVVQTASGDITLASPGAISTGTLLSARNLNVSGSTVTANGITAHGALTLSGATNVGGQVLASGSVFISGQSLSAQTLVAGLDFHATDAAGGNIVLGQTGNLTVNVNGAVTVPTIQAAGDVDVSGATITADAVTGHKNIKLSAATDPVGSGGHVDISNQVLGGGSLALTGSHIQAGAIISGVDFAATGASNGHVVQTASGDIALTSTGAVGIGTLLSAHDLSASGATIVADKITAHGAVTLAGATSVSGQILAAGNVFISGQSLSALTLISGLDFKSTDAAGGNIVLGQTGDLSVNVDGAVLVPTIQAAGRLTVSGASVKADQITGHKDITLSGATAGVNVANQVLGGGHVGITGSSIQGGAIIGGVDFAATAAGGGGGIALSNEGGLTLASANKLDAGTLLSAGDFSASGTTVNARSITAHGDLTLSGAINVDGQILAAGNVLISGQSVSSQALVAGIDFDATRASGGNILLGKSGDLKLNVAGSAAAPIIQAAGMLDVGGASVTADAITGHGAIALSGVAGGVNVTNQVLGGGDVDISGSSIKVGAVVSGIDFARTTAANGNILLTSSGDLTLASIGSVNIGSLLSVGNLKASGSAITVDAITAHGNILLDGAISVTSQILGAGNVLISGQRLSAQTIVAGIDFDVTTGAGGKIALGRTGDLTVSVDGAVAASTLQSAGKLDIGGSTVAAGAVTSQEDVSLSAASGRVDLAGQVLGGGKVNISGSGIKVGTIVSGVDFARTAAANGNIVQTASGDLTLASTGSIDAGILLSAGALSVKGGFINADAITAHAAIILTATGATAPTGAVNIAGQILGAGNVSITGQSLSAQTIASGIDFGATDASGGNIVLGPAGDLTVSVNGAIATSTVQAGGSIDIRGASVTADAITGHQDIGVAGTSAGGVRVTRQVLGGGGVSISGSGIQAGTIVSGVDFAGTALAHGDIVLAGSGDLKLASSGIIKSGTLLSAGGLSAKGSTINVDSITAHANVALDGATTVGGQILGAGDVLITGKSLAADAVIAGVDFAATNSAGGNIILGKTGNLSVAVDDSAATSTMQAAGNLDASGATVTAGAITGFKDITLAGRSRVDINGQVLGAGNVTLSGSNITAGALVSGVNFAATSAGSGDIVLSSSGDLRLSSNGTIRAGTLLSAGTLDAVGSEITAAAITAHGDIGLNDATQTSTADGRVDVAGQILGAGNVRIGGQDLKAQTVVAGIDFAGTNASGGDIQLGRAGNLTALLSGAFLASTVEAAGDVNVNAATVTANAVTSHKDTVLSGATAGSGSVDVSGQVLSGGKVEVSASSIAAGAIVSGVDFAGTAAANGTIVQTASGDLSLASTGNIAVGTLLSAGDLAVDAANLTAAGLTAHGNANLKASGMPASGRIDVTGQVLSAGDVTIDANSFSAGLLVSGIDFAATNGSGGNIVLAGSGAIDLTVSGNAAATTILSAGDFTAKAGNLQASSVTSHGNVSVDGSLDISSQVLSSGDLRVRGASIKAPVLISGVDFAATNAAGDNIVLAHSGAMVLTATGDIASQTILAASDITANAADLTADSITGHGNIGIFGNADIANQIIAAGNLTFSGGHISASTLASGVDFGAMGTSGGIALGSSGDMKLTASSGINTKTLLSAGNIDASGAAITANAVTGHGAITLAGSDSVAVTGQLLGAGDVTISGPSVQLGQVVTGVDFATTAKSANGAIQLGSAGDLDITGASASAGTLIVAGSLDVASSAFTGGNITGHGAVSIGSSTNLGAVAINGQLLGGRAVSITGSTISGNTIVAGVDFDATAQSATGNIVLGQAAGSVGDLTMKATSGNLTVNSLMAAGNITANAANNVTANAVAHGGLIMTAGNTITLSGQSLSSGDVNLTARSISVDTLVSGVDFAATNASTNGSLMLRRAGTMTLAASSGSISANSLLSGGNLAATATQNISYNSLQSLGNAALSAPGAIAYTNTTRVGGNLTLNTGALDLSGGRGSRISGGGTLIVNATSASFAGSNLVFGGLTLNLSGGVDLSNAQLSTVTNAGGSGDINISAAGLSTNAATSLLAGHDLTLNLPALYNTGQLASANSLTFNVASDFSNTPTGLVFAGNNANFLVGGTLTNNQGALLAGNGLAIAGPGGGQRNGAVVNVAGLIQSGGAMSILTNGLSNATTSAPSVQRNIQIADDILHAYDRITDSGTTTGIVHQIIDEDRLISQAGASAKIRAGGTLTINATNLWNSYSSIKSDGDMTLNVAGTLTNEGTTLNRISEVTCNSSTPCQYYPDKEVKTTTLNCSGPNRPCIEQTKTDYQPNPNGKRDPSKDLNPGTTVTGVTVIGAISGDIKTSGALRISAGAINNGVDNGSIAGQVAIEAKASQSNPLGALNSMTAGGALFNVSAALSSVATNGGATATSAPSLSVSGPAIGSGPMIAGTNLTAAVGASINGGSLTANGNIAMSGNGVATADRSVISGSSVAIASNAAVSSGSLTATNNASISASNVTTTAGPAIGVNGVTAAPGASVNGNGVTAATGASISAGGVTAAPGTTINGNAISAASGPVITGDALTAGNASVSPNSLMGKLTAAIGNSGNLTQVLQTNGAALAALSKPQSGGVGGTAPGQVFLFETRAAFLDVSKFYGSAYFIDRVGYTPETQVPFLGDAYFDNQLIDEQMRQLVGDGLGAGSFIPGNNATDQMKTLLDNGVAYAEAHGLALGQALTPEQTAALTQSMVIYQTEIVDGAPVLVPVVYLSEADRAKVTSGATISGNTVSIDAASVDNSGAIAAADGMTINANNIKANGGAFLAGGNMNLNAENGITLAAQTMNIGGQTVLTANGGVTAGGNLKLDAGAGGLTLSGTKVAAGGGAQLSGQTVTLGAVKQDNGGVQTLAGATVTTGGNLSIAGTNGVNVIASSAKVGGDLSILSSSGSVNIISAGIQNTTVDVNRGTITTTTSQIQQGSSLIAGGSVLVSGNQGILIGGSSIDAKGNLGLVAANGNIAITASEDQVASQSKTTPGSYNGYKGGQSSSTALTNNGSSLTSENGGVTVQADNGNISVIGSDVDAKGGTANLIAKGDITVGEATDTEASSGKSGKRKSSETTTTAEGSSISGQTGVNIGSSAGNVTISASDIAAGDATHAADANIQAAGNVVIASGKDTKETTTDSKSSGFLSSSKTHTHSYDEDNVGSSVSASGNITVKSGGETVVSGSNLAAGDNLSLSGSTVTVMGAEEKHESDKQTKKSGIGVGSGGGFISIYGSKDSKSSRSETDNIGSTISSGGTTTITSTEGDVNIFGSSSHSGDGTVISSARDVNIAPGAEEQSSSSQTKRSGFGISFSSGDGSLSVGIGVGKSEEKRSKDANTNAVSTLDSDGSITIAANRNINDQSGQILAAGVVGLIAGDNVNMLSSNDVTNASEMQKKSFAGVSITVQSSLIAAGQQAAQAGSLLSGDNGIYGIAPAVLAGVKGYEAISSTLKAIDAAPDPITGNRPAIASVSLTAGYSFSESSQESTTSIPVPPVINGSSVTIVAQSGDVNGRGVQINAGMGKDGRAPIISNDPSNGSVLISAAGNVDLESVQATTDSKSTSKAGSASIGISASLDASGTVFNAGPTANAAYGSGKQASSSVTQLNSNVSGTNTVTVVAGDTLTLAGGVLSGNTVNASAANGILIESRQDTASYDEKSKSAKLGISSGGISGGYNQGIITGDYANVSQQSGIFAGAGGYHVATDGIIDLKGGFIGSTADPKANDLIANQILYSNIENSMSASSTSYGIGLLGSGIPVPVVGQPAKQDDHGATLATVTPGNWNLTGQSQDLSGLNTDASKANNQVDPFDIDRLKAQQQSAAALSALLNMGVGELSEQLGFAEGSPEKIALHAAVGVIVSQVAGTNAGAGALGGALSEIANGVLQQVLQANPNLTDMQKSAITQWVAAAVGAAAGGGTGAAAALDNVNYNYLTHKEAKELELAELACRGGSAKDCKRHDELLDLSQTRDDQLKDCVGNSSSECVKARTDLRVAAAEYVDAALTGNGDYVTPIGGLQRQWALLQAYDYADDSDLGKIADADRIVASFKSDEAKALLTASKSGLSAALRSEILYGIVTLGQNGPSGRGPTTSGRGSETSVSGSGLGNWPRSNVVVDGEMVIRQVDNSSCGQACGAMVLRDRGIIVQPTDIGSGLSSFQIGSPDSLVAQISKAAPNVRWASGHAEDLGQAFDILTRPTGGSWIAELRGTGSVNHAVVVDGITSSGVTIRDPWDQTVYNMTKSDFINNWTGGFIGQ